MSAVVYLVGAGPGDPDLVTVRAMRLLGQADAVVCDRLVGAGILALIAPKADFFDVGKAAGKCRLQQDDINQLLLKLSRTHKTIVRLKGGDPFVFGRGGEELLFLTQYGVKVQVVPGITAALGCAAASGIPLTHRAVASSVRFVTGHVRDSGELNLNWASLADPACTVVFYMAVGNATDIVDALVRHGRDPATPAALIHAGTMPQQICATTQLRDIPQRIQAFAPPTLLIVGDVVDLYAQAQHLHASRHSACEPSPAASPTCLPAFA